MASVDKALDPPRCASILLGFNLRGIVIAFSRRELVAQQQRLQSLCSLGSL